MKRLYDWDRWFGRPRIVLKYGVHYNGTQSSFGQQIRNAARKRGVSVSIEDNRDHFILRVLGAVAIP